MEQFWTQNLKKNGFRTSQEANKAIQLLQKEHTSFIASTQATTSFVNVMPSAPQACTEENFKADELLFLPNDNQQLEWLQLH